MRPLFDMVLHGLRHAAVGVAVLSVLMMTFRVHLHAQADDGCGHSHGFELSIGSALDDDPGLPAEPNAADPDGCGSCHCPTSSVTIAEIPGVAIHAQVSDLACLAHPAAVPDSRSYPPDPPPVRLS